jgi:glucose/arabinose dehydrogenase
MKPYKIIHFIFFLTLFLSSPLSAGSFPPLQMTKAFPHLKFHLPVWMTAPPTDNNRFFVVEQKGSIRVFKNNSKTRKTSAFLDISKKVRYVHAEEGLLCMAFHPQYAANGLFYVFYLASNPHRQVLSQFKVSSKNPDRADPTSEKILLEIPKRHGNHNGSTILFGPDGYLYVSLGDGGGAGDRDNNAQNLGNLWGKVLRVDVDRQDKGLPYAIPPDNPFVGKEGARGEIWAYGLRNVWRMSFDRKSGTLWAGDVGQDKWEEIDIIQRGGNYGWPYLEGTHDYRNAPGTPPSIPPVLEYPHPSGVCVTGGYVYRGSKLKGYEGAYLYAEYVFGWVKAARFAEGGVAADEKVIEQNDNISSFAEDNDGELYLLGYSKGRIYKLKLR